MFGGYAARIGSSVDNKLYPTEFRASTLKRYVAPAVNITEVV